MTAAAPSWNAQRAAESRAIHQLSDHPRVFDDPLAVAIAGGEIGRAPESRSAEVRRQRALMAARSRYAEDGLNAAVARGARQYVIVGAGLDTYGYRNGHANLRVFEVDHPSTQAWKRARLRAAGIAIPPSLVFVQAGFDQQSLPAVLESAGFQSGEVTFFSWLACSTYGSAQATVATLAFIGSLRPEAAWRSTILAAELDLIGRLIRHWIGWKRRRWTPSPADLVPMSSRNKCSLILPR